MEKKILGQLVMGNFYTSGGSATQYISSLDLGEQGISINMWNSDKQIERGKEVAELIVTAVNAYSPMLEALKSIAECKGKMTDADANGFRIIAQKAIALAENQQ